MDVLELTIDILETNLQLNGAMTWERDTLLLGSIPEFNSLTITSILTSIEDQTGEEVDDSEISAEIFETVGSLADFIGSKLD